MFKKAAILFVAAFYLLLSTGMYVCAMHCATGEIFCNTKNSIAHSTKQMPGMACCENEHQKPAKETNNCKTKHGSYLVNENIKPSASFQLFEIKPVSLAYVLSYNLQAKQAEPSSNYRAYSHAPPPVSARSYLIRIRALLI